MLRRLNLIHPLLFALLAARVAAHAEEASDWSKSFVPSALQSYLASAQTKLIVVPAGSDSPALRSAAEALEAGLRATAGVAMVMDSSAIGPVQPLDDASIVKKCESFPVDQIVLLRLFPDSAGQLSTAVVTFYDKSSRVAAAFTAEQGKPVASKAVAENVGQGVSSQAAATVSQTLKDQKKTDEGANEEYDLHYIGFDDVIAVSGYGSVLNRWSVPYEGKYKKPLEGTSFYEKIGRQDLVKSYEQKQSLRVVLGIAGGAAVVGGLVYAFTGRDDCSKSSNFSSCVDRNISDSGSRILIGSILMLGGGGLILGAVFINPHPIAPSEARQLAEEYNQRLKKKTGVSDANTRESPGAKIAIAPYLVRNGGGLQLGVSF